MFGPPSRAARRIRTFRAAPFASLCKVCSRLSGGWSCGLPLHAQTDASLLDSFRVPPARLLKQWAGAIASWALTETSRRRIAPVDSGRVYRHRDRGESPESRRARRKREDEESTAGARNPARIVASMPDLLAVASRLRAALLRSLNLCPSLVDAHLACGPHPPRLPPAPEDVAIARQCVCDALNLSPEAGEQHHRSSPLRFRIFEALIESVKDPDWHVAEWLRGGAPLGVTCPVPPGGHFPTIEPGEAPSDAEWARDAPMVDKNHGSFQQPAREQLEQLVEKGFARIYASRAAAEEALGGKCYPAPLGDVVKPLPGGR